MKLLYLLFLVGALVLSRLPLTAHLKGALLEKIGPSLHRMDRNKLFMLSRTPAVVGGLVNAIVILLLGSKWTLLAPIPIPVQVILLLLLTALDYLVYLFVLAVLDVLHAAQP